LYHENMNNHIEAFRKALSEIESVIARMRRELDEFDNSSPEQMGNESSTVVRNTTTPIVSLGASPPPRSLAVHHLSIKSRLSAPERAILSAIASLESVRPLEMHPTLIAALAGFLPSAKRFQETFNSLKEQNLIATKNHTVRLTDEGSRFPAAEIEPLTTEILAERIAMQLTRHQSIIFRFLFEKGGATVHRNEIIEKCGKGRDDNSFQKELLALQRLALVKQTGGKNYACAELIYLG
jgi:hypothetical protein